MFSDTLLHRSLPLHLARYVYDRDHAVFVVIERFVDELRNNMRC